METMSCTIIAIGEPVAPEMELTCPICGPQAVLIPLGARLDRPHRWRPWVVVETQLALCPHCDAIAATDVTEMASLPPVGLWQPAVSAA